MVVGRRAAWVADWQEDVEGKGGVLAAQVWHEFVQVACVGEHRNVEGIYYRGHEGAVGHENGLDVGAVHHQIGVTGSIGTAIGHILPAIEPNREIPHIRIGIIIHGILNSPIPRQDPNTQPIGMIPLHQHHINGSLTDIDPTGIHFYLRVGLLHTVGIVHHEIPHRRKREVDGDHLAVLQVAVGAA